MVLGSQSRQPRDTPALDSDVSRVIAMVLPLRSAARMVGHLVSWNGEVHPSDVLAVLALLITAGTVILLYRQVRIGVVANRARFLFDLVHWYYGNVALRHLYYQLDWRKWKFEPDTFPMSDDEPSIDHLLTMLDMVGHLIELNVLSVQELSILRFDMIRVVENPEVIKYLHWLDDECRSIGLPPESIFPNVRSLVRRVRQP
jgi:hypothetical protein